MSNVPVSQRDEYFSHISLLVHINGTQTFFTQLTLHLNLWKHRHDDLMIAPDGSQMLHTQMMTVNIRFPREISVKFQSGNEFSSWNCDLGMNVSEEIAIPFSSQMMLIFLSCKMNPCWWSLSLSLSMREAIKVYILNRFKVILECSNYPENFKYFSCKWCRVCAIVCRHFCGNTWFCWEMTQKA